jgi:hypothetical protein
MWTIYENPLDHPGRHVVRAWTIWPHGAEPDMECTVVDTLTAARETLPPGLVCMPRQRDDDPCIVESWL